MLLERISYRALILHLASFRRLRGECRSGLACSRPLSSFSISTPSHQRRQSQARGQSFNLRHTGSLGILIVLLACTRLRLCVRTMKAINWTTREELNEFINGPHAAGLAALDLRLNFATKAYAPQKLRRGMHSKDIRQLSQCDVDCFIYVPTSRANPRPEPTIQRPKSPATCDVLCCRRLMAFR